MCVCMFDVHAYIHADGQKHMCARVSRTPTYENHTRTNPEGEWKLPEAHENLKMFPVVAFKHREDVLSMNIATEGFPQRPMAYNVADLPPLPLGPAPEVLADGTLAPGLARLETIHSQTLATAQSDGSDAPASHLETDRDIATVMSGLDLSSFAGGGLAATVTDTVGTVETVGTSSSSSERSLYDRNHSGTTASEAEIGASIRDTVGSNARHSFGQEGEEGSAAATVGAELPSSRPVTAGLPPTQNCAEHEAGDRPATCAAPSALPSDPLRGGGGWGGVWKEGGRDGEGAEGSEVTRGAVDAGGSERNGNGSGGGHVGGAAGVSSPTRPSTRPASRASTAASSRPATGCRAMVFTRPWRRKKLLGRGAFGSVFEVCVCGGVDVCGGWGVLAWVWCVGALFGGFLEAYVSHIHTRTHGRTFLHTHTRMRARARAHTHTHTHTYTHTHTHTQAMDVDSGECFAVKEVLLYGNDAQVCVCACTYLRGARMYARVDCDVKTLQKIKHQ